MNGLRTAKRPSRLRDSPALQRLTRGSNSCQTSPSIL